MTTVIRTRKTRKPETRTARLMHLGNSTVLALTTGKDTTFYRLETLAADRGRGFRLSKADCGNGPAEVYNCLLDGQFSSCECKGFLNWNHCKHLESLTALAKSGKLPTAQTQPAPVEPEPAEEEETIELTEDPPQPAPEPEKPAPSPPHRQPKYTPIPGKEDACIYGPFHDEDIYGNCCI
jgi:hypothetical protein